MFTKEQWASLARTALQMGGAALVTRGVVDKGTAATLVDATIIAGGALMAIGTTLYSVYIRRKAGIIESAAALPEVNKIVTTQKLADKIDDPTVVTK